jgi:hypothetical protein
LLLGDGGSSQCLLPQLLQSLKRQGRR